MSTKSNVVTPVTTIGLDRDVARDLALAHTAFCFAIRFGGEPRDLADKARELRELQERAGIELVPAQELVGWTDPRASIVGAPRDADDEELEQ